MVSAIIVAAGSGARAGFRENKVLRELNGLGYRGRFFHRTLGNGFLPQSSVKTIFEEYGLDAASLLREWEGGGFRAD